MEVSAAIYGCGGLELSPAERAFFRAANPWGFILFRRNIRSAEQVRALCHSLRECVGRDAPILVDHEGGRVTRLSPELAPLRPPAAVYGSLAAISTERALAAARLGGELLARDASALGFNVNCVPMVDVRDPAAHDIVGDRAFGDDAALVAALGAALAEGSLAGGCLPVVKHIPGHGRARSDSHHELPRVDADRAALVETDFQPFHTLAHLPLGMTAHIVYSAIDPDLPATLSATVISEIIRRHIGFDGLLMTDDLSMKALTGSFADRAALSLRAGCDVVLHCNGDMAEMDAVAHGAGPLSAAARARSNRALAQLRRPAAVDMAAQEAAFAALTSTAALA